MNIASITPIRPAVKPESIQPSSGAKTGQADFRSMFESAAGGVEKLRTDANQAIDQLLTGEREDIHTVAMATQKAEMAFDMFVQVRNKVTQAYQEVMRMQI